VRIAMMNIITEEQHGRSPMHFGVVWVVELLQHEAVGGIGYDLLRHSYRSVHTYSIKMGSPTHTKRRRDTSNYVPFSAKVSTTFAPTVEGES